MFQIHQPTGRTVVLATVLAVILARENTFAQQPQFIPINPKPGTNFPQPASGFQTNGATPPTYRTAALNQGQGQVQQPPNRFDGFAVQNPPAVGPASMLNSPQTYYLAQVPQAAPPQVLQPPQVFVPQNYVAPTPQPNPVWSPTNANQFGSSSLFEPLWTAQLNALYMTRSNPSSFPLLFDAAGAPAVNANQLDFGWQWGFDVALSRRYGSYRNFELRYFQIDGWTAQFAAPFGPGSAIGTTPPTILPGMGTANYIYDSSVRSFEMNLVNRLLINERFRFALGFRWMELSENFSQTFVTAMPPDYAFVIDTNNHLYGLQIGGDGVLVNAGRLSIAGWIKAGIYANVADQSTLVTPAGPMGPMIANGIRRTSPSFVGETGLIGDLELFPRLSLIGGYQLMWISGTALAADQLPNMSSVGTGVVPSVLDQSDAFYHGIFFGVDVHW